MLRRLSRARVPPLTRYVRSQSARPLSTSKYAIAVGAVAAAAVIGTVWSPRPIALDADSSRSFTVSPAEPKPGASDISSAKKPLDGAHKPEKSEQEPTPSPAPSKSESAPEGVVKSDDGIDEHAETGGDSGGGAFNPETGEINWDCPCLGGMAHGPCGPEFRAAFSCFVHSEDEPKGINCVEKFQGMQTCFREHPEVYASEIADDEAAEAAEREEGASLGTETDKDSDAPPTPAPSTEKSPPLSVSPSASAPKASEEGSSSQ